MVAEQPEVQDDADGALEPRRTDSPTYYPGT